MNLHCHWNIPNDSEDDCDADTESHTALGNAIKDLVSPEHGVVRAVTNVSGLIWPAWSPMQQAEKELTTVSPMKTRRNKSNKKKWD